MFPAVPEEEIISMKKLALCRLFCKIGQCKFNLFLTRMLPVQCDRVWHTSKILSLSMAAAPLGLELSIVRHHKARDCIQVGLTDGLEIILGLQLVRHRHLVGFHLFILVHIQLFIFRFTILHIYFAGNKTIDHMFIVLHCGIYRVIETIFQGRTSTPLIVFFRAVTVGVIDGGVLSARLRQESHLNTSPDSRASQLSTVFD